MKLTSAFRWTARYLSIILVTIFVLLFLGEGPPPLFELSIIALQSWLLILAVAALVAAWRFEFVGGLIGLLAVLFFYFANFAIKGSFPRGCFFPIFGLTPLLFILARWHGCSHGKRARHNL